MALRAQADLQQSQVEIGQAELPNLRKLYEDGYAPQSALITAELRQRNLAGERQQMLAQAAQAEDRVAGYRLQALQLDAQQRTDTVDQLNQVEAKLEEIRPREEAAAAQLKDEQVRAPHGGVIHQLQLHSVGEVIGAGEMAMMIVPDNEPIAADLFISPGQINQISTGQIVRLRLDGGDPLHPDELRGTVQRVSSDVEHDQTGAKSFFIAHVTVPAAAWKRVTDMKVRPGLPLTAFVADHPKTLLSDFLKLVSDRLQRPVSPH